VILILTGCQTQNIKDKLSGDNVKRKKETEVVDKDTLDIKEVKDKKVDVKEGVIIAKADDSKEKDVDIVVNKNNEEEISVENMDNETETSTETSKDGDTESLERMEGYRIQLMAATEKSNAAELGEEFKEKWKEAREDEDNEDSYFYRKDIPIYLEYYKPYWKLRVGNYKKKKQAEDTLKYIKEIGFEDAWIVKTYILGEKQN